MKDDDGGPSDESLAQRMLAGDEDAARLLVERYERPLFATLLRVTRDRGVAEDLFQETFLRALRSGGRYDRSRRFQPWLFAIALNLAKDHARRLAHAATPLLSVEGVLPEPVGLRADAGAASVRRIDLSRAIERLPDAQREAVVLRYVEGLEEGEIAAASGIARGTVKSRLHHAIRKLREILKEK